MLIALHSVGQQAGKDTAVGFIKEWCAERDLEFERRAFADAPKVLVADALGIDYHGSSTLAVGEVDCLKLEGHVGYSVGDRAYPVITGRDFVINVANSVRRIVGDNTWTNLILPPLQPHFHHHRVVVITDLRFESEAMVVVERFGGRIIQVINPRAVDPGGRSEEGISPRWIDRHLVNDGSMALFHHRVKEVMGAMKTRLPI